MSRRQLVSDEAISAFVSSHPGWETRGDAVRALSKSYSFATYPDGIAFVVRLGFAAEKRDHHPDLDVRWGSVRVNFSTHDAGGISAVDFEMAELCDRLYRGDA